MLFVLSLDGPLRRVFCATRPRRAAAARRRAVLSDARKIAFSPRASRIN